MPIIYPCSVFHTGNCLLQEIWYLCCFEELRRLDNIYIQLQMCPCLLFWNVPTVQQSCGATVVQVTQMPLRSLLQLFLRHTHSTSLPVNVQYWSHTPVLCTVMNAWHGWILFLVPTTSVSPPLRKCLSFRNAKKCCRFKCYPESWDAV